MYSVVVLMALSTSADAPDLGRRGSRNCHGCSGGCSGWYAGCSGYYGGCTGYRSYAPAYHHGGCCGGGMPYAGGGRAMPYERADTSPNAATVIVTLPGPGWVGIDDYRSTVISNRHTYITAPLGTNETRKITFWTDVMRDGKRERVSKEVTVKPGQRAEVNLGAK